MTPTATSTFAQEYAAARAAETKAAHALTTALKHVEPVSTELHELFLTRPQSYATALRKTADILESLPALREAAKAALDAVSALAPRACWYCDGTGRYAGPTSALRQGVPYCFRCNGTGEAKRKP